MRMRGSLAGPERVMTLAPGLSLLLPDGTVAGQPGPADSGALAALLSGPSVPEPTGVRARPAQVFWELGLWLATREPRSFLLNVEGPDSLLAAAALRGPGRHSTVGIADGGGIAVLTADRPAGEGADRPAGEGEQTARPGRERGRSPCGRPASARGAGRWPQTSRRRSGPGTRRACRGSRACTSTPTPGPLRAPRTRARTLWSWSDPPRGSPSTMTSLEA